MKEWIYATARRLYFKNMLPQSVWNFVYKKLHRSVKDKWAGERKGKKK